VAVAQEDGQWLVTGLNCVAVPGWPPTWSPVTAKIRVMRALRSAAVARIVESKSTLGRPAGDRAAELFGGPQPPALVAGHELDALRAAWARRRPSPRHLEVNGVAASGNWVSRVTSFRVEGVHHSIIIYLTTRRIRFCLLYGHNPFRHGPTLT